MSSSAGSKLELQPDGSVFVAGPNAVGAYTIKAETHLAGITAMRLEALTDARSPCGGPGRGYDGNFILSEVRVQAAPLSDPTKQSAVPIQDVRADFNQDGWPCTAMIDGNPGAGWGVHPNEGKNHAAVFQLRESVGFAGGTLLTVELDQQYPGASLGRFRLSISTAAHPPEAVASVKSPNVDMKARILASPVPTGEYEPQVWHYTLDRPPDNWGQPDFQDTAWPRGAAAFGQSEFVKPRTFWNSSDIWLRRDFELADGQPIPSSIRIMHDEDAEVYINGALALQLGGFQDFLEFEIPPAVRSIFKPGRNVLAVHCHQNSGGQYIDVGLLDSLPSLPVRPVKEVKVVRGKPIDLLELIDPKRDAFAGRWTLVEGVLSSPAENAARLQIPFAPPSEYKLTVVGEREAGKDLMIGLVVDGKQVLLVLDGWGGTITGIAGVDGKEVNANPTTKQLANVLGDRRQYKVICNVRGRHIEVQVNGTTLINWSGTSSSIPSEWMMPRRDQLFIGAFNAVHHIKAITLIPKSTGPSSPTPKAAAH